MSMAIGRFQFMDSLQHLNASLEKLAKGLGGNLPYLKKEFPTQFELLARKGVYPYEYMNSFERFYETKLLRVVTISTLVRCGMRCAVRHLGIITTSI